MPGAILLPLWLAAAPNPYLAQARNDFQALEYEKCLQLIERSHSWKDTSTAELAEIELYGGLCSAPLGHLDDARERFKLACRIDTAVQLPPLSSPKVISLFEQSCPKRPEVAPPPEEPKTLTPPVPAVVEPPAPVVVAPAPAPSPPSRWALKISLLAAGVAGVATGAVFTGLSQSSFSQARAPDAFFTDRTAAWKSGNVDLDVCYVAFSVGAAALLAALITFLISG